MSEEEKDQPEKTRYAKFEKEHRYKPYKEGRGRIYSTIENVPTFSIINHKSYRFFLDNKKITERKDVKNYVEYGKIISEFYRIVGEKMVESTGGVYIEDLGYFGVVQEFVKRSSTYTGPKLNLHTDRMVYNLAYVPIDKTNNFKSWTFDYSFVDSVKKKLSKALKKGKKYTFNPSLFFNNVRVTKAKDF